MMTFKDGLAQVIELVPTALTLVSLSMGLMGVKTTLMDDFGSTFRAAHAFWLAQLTDDCKAFFVVNQVLDVEHACIIPDVR
jgi:hypothetical protein